MTFQIKKIETITVEGMCTSMALESSDTNTAGLKVKKYC